MKTECIGVKCSKINCDKHKKQSRAKVDPRDRDNITEEEFESLVRPHSKEDLAYIDADHSSVSFAYEANDGTDDYDDLTIKDMQKIDKACMNYLEKQVSKDKFNPSDIGSKSSDVMEASLMRGKLEG